MNSVEFFDSYPYMQQTLLNSKFLEIIPGGFSIATDASCKTIVHNPIMAKFFRIKPWGQLSCSATEEPPVKVFRNGKPLGAHELPTQRAAWYGEEVIGCELEFVWEDGVSKVGRFSSIPLRDEKGNICGAITSMEEITDLIHRFTKAFYLSPQQKSIIRLSDLRYIDVNESFARARNHSRSEIIGKTPIEIGVPPEEVKKVINHLREHGSIKNFEVSIPKQNGNFGVALLSADYIIIEGQECGLFDYTDITEMKQMQAEIDRLDRLNLVGQMAAGIGHEIRNPLTTVRGYLQLLGSKEKFAEYADSFEMIIGEIDRANSIITEFLSLTKSKPTQLKYQNLNAILANLYPLLEADAFNQNKQLKLITGEIPDIKLNEKEIYQLVLNMCHNGLEAMKAHGCLTIRTYREGEQVVLSIQDDGCGISSEDVVKLGTPFFTTKETGTGLGLATCYGIAARHNARIDVDTGLNGTTFFIRFATG